MSSRSASTFLSTTPTIRSMSGTTTSRWKRVRTVSRSSDIRSLFYRLAGPRPDLHIAVRNADVETASGEGGGARFPEMKVDWRTHPDNVGHFYSQGCFRCHDNQHASRDG